MTIVRPFNLYGPGQDSRFLIPLLVEQVLNPAQPEIRVADPTPRRDYLHVEDFARLLLLTIDGPPGVYNAGSGSSNSIAELVEYLLAAAGVRKPLAGTNQNRRNEIPDVVAGIARAAGALGWKPRIGLPEGLTGLVKRDSGRPHVS